VEWANAPKGANSVQVVTQITKRLKALAKALGITIVLLSQLSRDVDKRDDKHPMMADFRESGSIEQDADIVVGLVRPMRYAQHAIKAAKNAEQRHAAILAYDDAKNVVEAGVLKNRGGRESDYFRLFIEEKASVVRGNAPDHQPEAGEFDYGALEKELRG
jgi:replicative DNA helicase